MNLKQTMRKSGITIQKMVDLTGLSRGTITTAIQNKKAIRYVNAQLMVDAINNKKGTNYTVEDLSILTIE